MSEEVTPNMPALPTQEEISRVPALLVDGVAGTTQVGNILRLTFVDHVFNIAPGATNPKVRPTITLAGTVDMWRTTATAVLEAVAAYEASQ